MNFPQLLLDSPRHRSPHCSPHAGLIFTLIFSPQSRGCLEGAQRQHPGVIQELRRCHGKHPKKSNPHMTAGFDPGQSGTPKIWGGERSGMWGLQGWTSTSSRVRTHKDSFPLHAQPSCSMPCCALPSNVPLLPQFPHFWGPQPWHVPCLRGARPAEQQQPKPGG